MKLLPQVLHIHLRASRDFNLCDNDGRGHHDDLLGHHDCRRIWWRLRSSHRLGRLHGSGFGNPWSGSKETSLKVMALENRKAGLSTRFVEKDGHAVEALLNFFFFFFLFFFFFFFFFSCSTVESGEEAKENPISTAEGSEEAGDEGSVRSDEGSDPNRAPEEDEPDSSDISLKRESNKISVFKIKKKKICLKP